MQINPYLMFKDNCREAMSFYKDCIGGELFIQTVGESPMAQEASDEEKKRIMHASLTKDGSTLLMASDMMDQGDVVHGTDVTLSLNCSSEEEITSLFAKLSAGGNVSHPLKLEFWGALFGMFTDKYGMRWMLNYDKKKS